jgi:anti-sigma B factor antagonist
MSFSFDPESRDQARSNQLTVEPLAGPDGVVLVLRGELDLASAPGLAQALRDAEKTGSARLVIDLSKLTFMDCAGLRVLMLAQQIADSGARRLSLRSGPGAVRRFLELTGVVDHLSFEDQGSVGERHRSGENGSTPIHDRA